MEVLNTIYRIFPIWHAKETISTTVLDLHSQSSKLCFCLNLHGTKRNGSSVTISVSKLLNSCQNYKIWHFNLGRSKGIFKSPILVRNVDLVCLSFVIGLFKWSSSCHSFETKACRNEQKYEIWSNLMLNMLIFSSRSPKMIISGYF